MEKKVIVELTPLMAKIFQRVLVEEIERQKRWKIEEIRQFGIVDNSYRETIIEQCEQVRNQLEQKGFEKYYKY